MPKLNLLKLFPLHSFDLKEVDLSHLPDGFDKEKLKTIKIDYDDRIRDKNVSESTIPYEHTIQLYDMNEGDVFTVVDLKSAYWHIHINECDKNKAAFVVPNAKYLQRVLLFGLTDAAFLLSLVMFNILNEFRSFIFVMLKQFTTLINLQSLAFKLILRSDNLRKSRCC